eukprot:6190165-Pleurochrysis_carterae.AAC.1
MHLQRVHAPSAPAQVLDTETLRLSPLLADGESGGRGAPEEREGHTASIVRGEIYIFGGTWTDDENVTLYMNDLHVLNTARGVWRRPVTTGTLPIEREGHSASVVGNLIYYFAVRKMNMRTNHHSSRPPGCALMNIARSRSNRR